MSAIQSYSRIFLEYADSLRSTTQGMKSAEKLSALLTLPEAIWNAVVIDEIKGTSHTQEILKHFETLPEPQRESGRKMAEYWVLRKKLQFGNYKWAVEHTVRVKNGELIVRVQAREVTKTPQLRPEVDSEKMVRLTEN